MKRRKRPRSRGRHWLACAGFSDLLFWDFVHVEAVEPLTADEIGRAVALALAEDIGSGGVTTLATVPATARASAMMVAREPLVAAGLALAEAACQPLSS